MSQKSFSSFSDKISQVLMVTGFILIALALIFYFLPLGKFFSSPDQTDSNTTNPTDSENETIEPPFLNYQSTNLSDEELAGSLPTELNQQTGTLDQNLGHINTTP